MPEGWNNMDKATVAAVWVLDAALVATGIWLVSEYWKTILAVGVGVGIGAVVVTATQKGVPGL